MTFAYMPAPFSNLAALHPAGLPIYVVLLVYISIALAHECNRNCVEVTFIKMYREYQIGLDIHQCHGRMRHTKIVTFVACYKLVNKTLHEIAFLQRFQTFKEVCSFIMLC